jgi:hypothetical protein
MTDDELAEERAETEIGLRALRRTILALGFVYAWVTANPAFALGGIVLFFAIRHFTIRKGR